MAKKQDPAKPAEETAAAPAGAEAAPKKEKKPREPKAKEPKAKTAPDAAAPEAAAPAEAAKAAPTAAPAPGESTKKRGAPGMPPRRGKKLRNQIRAHQQKI